MALAGPAFVFPVALGTHVALPRCVWTRHNADRMYTRRIFLFTAALPLFAQVSARARKLHEQAFVMDGHVHVINRQFYLGGDIGDAYQDGQVDLPRIRKGGVKAMFFSLFSRRVLPQPLRN